MPDLLQPHRTRHDLVELVLKLFYTDVSHHVDDLRESELEVNGDWFVKGGRGSAVAVVVNHQIIVQSLRIFVRLDEEKERRKKKEKGTGHGED